jgi:hypothetical protein
VDRKYRKCGQEEDKKWKWYNFSRSGGVRQEEDKLVEVESSGSRQVEEV